MRRGFDTRIWLVAALALAGTLFLLSSRGDSDDVESSIPPPRVKRPSRNPAGEISPSGEFKIPIYNRQGHQVIARFDSSKTQIAEINVTAFYTEGNEQKMMDLLVVGTSTNPPFAAVIANPHTEAASWDLWLHGDMEIPTRKMFEYLLNGRCDNGNRLVVDAGSNLGYFGSYAGVMGCRVVAFEPQPRLLPIIRTSVLVNGLGDRFELHNNIVNTDPSEKLKIVYAGGVCTGCSSVSKAKPGEKNTANSFIIDAVRIDEVVKEDVILMKVDVEGFEVIALESAENVFEKYNVLNILVEWFPDRFPHEIERGTRMLEKLYDMGYKIRHYDLRFNLPREWVTEESFPIGGRTWLVPRERLGEMNEWLRKQSYGEANLWISKER